MVPMIQYCATIWPALEAEAEAQNRSGANSNAAKIARIEEGKRKQQELKISQRYRAVGAEPPSPLPRRAPRIVNGVKIVLSDDANQFVDLVVRTVSKLPKPTRKEIREAVFSYIQEHVIQNDFAKTYWDINMGTANDMNAVFEAIKKDLSDHGELGTETERAIDTLETNVRSRVSDAAKDAAKTSKAGSER
jgi:hypothetical protein